MLVKSLIHPGERLLARVAVRFPEERNAAGFAFLTDQRVMFEFHEKVLSVALGYITFVGHPNRPSSGDFIIDADAPGGSGTVTTAMKVRDREAFHGFFPTLLDAARAVGAQPEVDTGWNDEPPAPPAPTTPPPPGQTRARRPAAATPSADVRENAIASFVRPDETVMAAANMRHNLRPEPVIVVATDSRLIVSDGPLIWSAALESVQVVQGGVVGTHLRVLVDTLNDWRVLGSGTGGVDPYEQRRLVLLAESDHDAAANLHRYLARSTAGVIENWPSA